MATSVPETRQGVIFSEQGYGRAASPTVVCAECGWQVGDATLDGESVSFEQTRQPLTRLILLVADFGICVNLAAQADDFWPGPVDLAENV
jgi:hypothetical protein